jgi:hypothetical protein
MKKVTIPFIRMDGTRLSTLAVVEFSLDNKKDPQTELRKATTAWTRKTKSGKAAWEYSGGDLNIGDIASHDDSGFAKYVELHGIKNFRIVYVGDTSDALPYDLVLADAEEE